MAKFYLDFSDASPTTVEEREVDSTSIEGISIPADAVQFSFWDEHRHYVGPTYWVTETVDRGSMADLLSRHPSAHPMFTRHAEKNGATDYALVTMVDPAGKYDVSSILPITADICFVERSTGKLLFA